MRRFRHYSDRHFEDRRYHCHEHRVPLSLDPVGGKIGGVCAGLARYFDVPAVFVRVGAILMLCLAPAAALSAYGVAYLILDKHY